MCCIFIHQVQMDYFSNASGKSYEDDIMFSPGTTESSDEQICRPMKRPNDFESQQPAKKKTKIECLIVKFHVQFLAENIRQYFYNLCIYLNSRKQHHQMASPQNSFVLNYGSNKAASKCYIFCTFRTWSFQFKYLKTSCIHNNNRMSSLVIAVLLAWFATIFPAIIHIKHLIHNFVHNCCNLSF